MAKQDPLLDRIYTWWVWIHIKLNGYKVAAAITIAMVVGIAIDNTNPFFDITETRFLFLSPVGWCIWFLIATVLLWRLRSGRWEVPIVVTFFAVPMILFYGTLFELTLHSRRPSVLILILILAALGTTLYSVTRTAAFNFYRDNYPKVIAENARLREKCGEPGDVSSGDKQDKL